MVSDERCVRRPAAARLFNLTCIRMITATLNIPDSGSEEECSIVVAHPGRHPELRTNASDFDGVVYLLWWLADLSDYSPDDDPGRRPLIVVKAAGGNSAAVLWLERVFIRNGGSFVGARELLEETGLIADPRLLVWLL